MNLKLNDIHTIQPLSLLLTVLNHKIPAECNRFKTYVFANNSSPKSVKYFLLTHCEFIAGAELPARHIPIESTISSHPLWASPRNWGEQLQGHYQNYQQLLWMILSCFLTSLSTVIRTAVPIVCRIALSFSFYAYKPIRKFFLHVFHIFHQGGWHSHFCLEQSLHLMLF